MEQPQIPDNPPQQQAQMQQPASQPQPGPGELTSRKTLIISAVIAVIVVVMLLALFFAGAIGGDPKATPQGTLNALVSANNNYDAKGALDCTIVKFYSASDYTSELNSQMSEMSYMKTSSYHFTMTDVSIRYSAQMTPDELSKVSLLSHGASVTVQDSCFASFTIESTQAGMGSGTISYGNVLLKIDGLWYYGMNVL